MSTRRTLIGSWQSLINIFLSVLYFYRHENSSLRDFSKIYIVDYVSQSCFHQQSVGCDINKAQGVSNYSYLVLPTCSRLITSLYFSMLDLQDDYKSFW